MSDSLAKLYYVHDPMCSWCWGFRPVWNQVQNILKDEVIIQYVLGGLAPDTQQPMPESMQNSIKETWKSIEKEIPGIEFNYDFWLECRPRRSTYPACRAVIAASYQYERSSRDMNYAIQKAYYLDAKNPSNDNTLSQLAKEIGLDVERFNMDLNSENCQIDLEQEMLLARKLNVNGYPSLVLSHDNLENTIQIDYKSSENIIMQINQNLGLLLS